MKSEGLVDKDFHKWSSVEVAAHLGKKGLKGYTELFQQHKIDGSVFHNLTEENLKEMGIESVGDRKKVMAAIKDLRETSDQKNREKILWKGKEVKYWSFCHWARSTSCGCCTDDPEKYTLRYNYLDINRPHYNRVCGMRCCFGHSWLKMTVDLSNISNVDIKTNPPPCVEEFCCCANAQEHVIVNLEVPEKGREVLRLKKGDGEAMKRKLINQVEIMQMMERS